MFVMLVTTFLTLQPLQTPSWAGSNASTGPSTPASTVLQASRDCDVSSSLGHNDGATLLLDQTESVTAPPTPMSPGKQIHPHS
jgi:hypothetical protein